MNYEDVGGTRVDEETRKRANDRQTKVLTVLHSECGDYLSECILHDLSNEVTNKHE